MATKYPYEVDDNTSLPKLVDGVSPMVVEDVNRLRDAVVAVQTELGADPSGTATSVAGRFTTLETSLQDYASGSFLTLSSNGYISNERIFTPSVNFAIIDGGAGLNYSIDLANTVGIGTTSPAADYSLTLNGNGSTRRGGLVLRQAGTDTFLIGNTATSNSTDIQLLNPRAGYVSLGTNNLERLRITDIGRLGVGTTTPAANFHIKGAAEMIRLETTTSSGSGNNYISFFDPSGYKGSIGYKASDSDLLQITNEWAPITFVTSGTERARVTVDGRFGIGTDDPKELFEVRGATVLGGYLSWGDSYLFDAPSIYASMAMGIDILPKGANPAGAVRISEAGVEMSGPIIGYNGAPPSSNGILIGNGSAFEEKTLVAGSGITITSTPTQITLSSSLAGGTVTSVSLATTLSGITVTNPTITTSGTISLGGTLGVANGGTGRTSLTQNALLLGNGTSAVEFVTGSANQYLRHDGATWVSSVLPTFVTTISGDSTISVAGSGTSSVSLSLGTVPATKGGTGFANYAIGDILYASSTTVLAKLTAAAANNVLISNGVGAAPSYGKVGLTTHVSGILPVANGGTGTSTAITQGRIIFAGSSGVHSSDAGLTWSATQINITNSTTSTSSINIGTQSQASAISKTVNIGTGGASGSSTFINIGSSTNTTDVNVRGSTIDIGTSASVQTLAGSSITLNTPSAVVDGDMQLNGSNFSGGKLSQIHSLGAASIGTGVPTNVAVLTDSASLQYAIFKRYIAVRELSSTAIGGITTNFTFEMPKPSANGKTATFYTRVYASVTPQSADSPPREAVAISAVIGIHVIVDSAGSVTIECTPPAYGQKFVFNGSPTITTIPAAPTPGTSDNIIISVDCTGLRPSVFYDASIILDLHGNASSAY